MSAIYTYGQWIDIVDRGTSGDQVMDILASWKVDAYKLLEDNHKLEAELARRDEELALTEKKLCNIDRSARAEVARRDEYISKLEAKIPKLNIDLAEASTHAYNGESARMKLEAELARLNAERRWIPVSERLPEMYHPVLTMAKKAKYPRVLSREKGADDIWVWALRQLGGYVAYIGEKNITHWMPLPPAPESEG